MDKSQFTSPILIGVSSCLLGENVRYDGGQKQHELIRDYLCNNFSCIPICPEVAIGLSVPRPPIQLIRDSRCIRAVQADDHKIDVSESLRSFAVTVSQQYPQLCGYVFTARSPSWGLLQTPIHNLERNTLEFGMGIFSAGINENHPELPMVEEEALNSQKMVDEFLGKVRQYGKNRGIVDP